MSSVKVYGKAREIVVTYLLYGVPYAFFAMAGDVLWGTVALYAVAMAAMGLLCVRTMRRNGFLALAAGNALSCVSSLLFVLMVQTEKWAWYFKPFRAEMLVMLISAAAFLAQAAVWYVCRKKQHK